MASIKKRPDGMWRARIKVVGDDGREREIAQHFARKVDGEQWLAKMHGDLDRGEFVDRRRGQVTFKQYAERWREAQVHREATRVKVEGIYRLHVYPTFGERRLASIRTTEVQAWVRKLEADLGPRSIDNAYRYLKAVFAAAVTDQVIAKTPCVGVRLPKAPPRLVVPFTPEQVAALIANTPDRYRAAIVVGAGTGVRLGELLGLTDSRFHPLKRTLRVDRQLVEIRGSGSALVPPKTQASYRAVPLAPVVVEALAAHMARYPTGPDGLIFTNASGGPIRHNRFGDMWRKVVEATPEVKGRESTRIHDLRHFFASSLIHHGESVRAVQALLGHATAHETLSTYAHLFPDSEDRARQAVQAVLLPASADFSRTTASVGA